jgi:hypothetical protein
MPNVALHVGQCVHVGQNSVLGIAHELRMSGGRALERPTSGAIVSFQVFFSLRFLGWTGK